MRLFLAVAALCVSATLVLAYPQSSSSQGVDPAYLRQYYAHLAQANRDQEATPIYESGAQEQNQAYAAPQIRQYQAAAPQQQYSQPQQAYKPKQAPRRPVYQGEGGQQRLRDEEEEEVDLNASYQFGFDVKDDEFTNYQNRQETRDNGVIKGSYSVVDSDGFIRTVKYTADPKEGFKAEVVREPTDIVVKIPPPHQERPTEQRHQNHQYSAPAYKQQPQQAQAQRQPAQYQYE